MSKVTQLLKKQLLVEVFLKWSRPPGEGRQRLQWPHSVSGSGLPSHCPQGGPGPASLSRHLHCPAAHLERTTLGPWLAEQGRASTGPAPSARGSAPACTLAALPWQPTASFRELFASAVALRGWSPRPSLLFVGSINSQRAIPSRSASHAHGARGEAQREIWLQQAQRRCPARVTGGLWPACGVALLPWRQLSGEGPAPNFPSFQGGARTGAAGTVPFPSSFSSAVTLTSNL